MQQSNAENLCDNKVSVNFEFDLFHINIDAF